MREKKNLFKMILFTFAIILLFSGTHSNNVQAAKKESKNVSASINPETKLLEIKRNGKVLYTTKYKKEKVYVKKDLSYVRKGPGIIYSKTYKIKKELGNQVLRVGAVRNNRWAIIYVKGRYYFVPNKHLSLKKPKVASVKRYTSSQLRYRGVIHWNGWRWTWYSQRRMPGHGLHIPGRHVNKNGYVCDKDGYICLASGRLGRGRVVRTPFGRKGKVYDSGCGRNTLDVYTNF